MAKNQKFIGMEAKKKGNGIFVDCGLLTDAGSRKEAQKLLEEYAEMKPNFVLTEKEALKMLKKLTAMLIPMKFGKKEEKRLQEMLRMDRKIGPRRPRR